MFYATRPHKLIQKDFRLGFRALLYITEGSGFHSVDFIRYPYKNGDIIFIQKNQVHHFEVNSLVRGYVININEPFFYKIKGFSAEVFLDFVDRAFGLPVLSLIQAPAVQTGF